MQKIIRQAFGKPVTIGLVGGHNLSICVSYLNMVRLSNNDCSNVGMLASCCSEMNEMRVLVQQQEPLSLLRQIKPAKRNDLAILMLIRMDHLTRRSISNQVYYKLFTNTSCTLLCTHTGSSSASHTISPENEDNDFGLLLRSMIITLYYIVLFHIRRFKSREFWGRKTLAKGR